MKRLIWHTRTFIFVFLLVLSGIIVSLTGIYLAHVQHEKNLLRLQDELNSVFSDVFQAMLDNHSEVLHSLVTARRSSPDWSDAYFASLTRNLCQWHPEFSRFLWIRRVTVENRHTYESTQQTIWKNPNFRIVEKDSSGTLIPAGTRPVYFPVTFISPDTNTIPRGLDLSMNSGWADILKRVSSLHHPVLTVKPLEGDSSADSMGGLPSYWVFYPVWPAAEEKNKGSGADGILACQMMPLQILTSHDFALAQRFGIRLLIRDITEKGDWYALGEKGWKKTNAPALSGSQRKNPHTFSLVGHRWEVVACLSPQFRHAFTSSFPSLLIGGGMFIIFILFAYFLTVFYLLEENRQVGQEHKLSLKELVKARTLREQEKNARQEAEHRLGLLIEQTPLGYIEWDMNLLSLIHI